MNRATPQMRHLAKRIIIYETKGIKSARTKTPDTFSDCEKLRPHLAALMGNEGCRALLSRAIALASAEVLWLRAVQAKAGETLKGLEELHAQMGSDKLFEGRIVLLAQLLGLLVAFIGENLTLRLLHEVWPKVPLHDLDLENGGKNEKTN